MLRFGVVRLLPHTSLTANKRLFSTVLRSKNIEAWTSDELADTLRSFNANKELLEALQTQRVTGKTLYEMNPATLYNLLDASRTSNNGSAIIPSDVLDSALTETLQLSVKYSMG